MNHAAGVAELKELLEAALSEAERVQSQIAPLERQLANARDRAELLRKLIELHHPNGTSTSSSTTTDASPASFEDRVEAVFRELGKPTHVSDLIDELAKAGVRIPG